MTGHRWSQDGYLADRAGVVSAVDIDQAAVGVDAYEKMWVLDVSGQTKKYFLARPDRLNARIGFAQYQDVDGGITVERDTLNANGPVRTIDFPAIAGNHHIELISVPHATIAGEYVWKVHVNSGATVA